MYENQNIEFKQSWRDEYLKWISGFANASGGKIYIGIDDSGNVSGLADAQKMLEDIPNKIVNYLGIVAQVNLLEKNAKKYIEIIVMPSSVPIS
jgi:ATP-dependent DNA helicase RecG